VHSPVPTLNDHIGASISKYFTLMKPTTTYAPAIQRYNWNLESSDKLRLLPSSPEHKIPFTKENVPNLIFRVERQTLRKLPKSGDILFTIGILHIPLRELVVDEQKKKALISHFRDDNLPDFRTYHRKYRQRQVILDFLEKTSAKL